MKKKILIGLAVLLLLVGGLAIFVIKNMLGPTTLDKDVTFVIPKGQAQTIIAKRLHDEGLISHPFVFRYVVWRYGLANKIQAGSFKLNGYMDAKKIAETLTKGTNDTWLTIPEGLRREEIAETIDELELPEFDKQEFLALTAGEEGKLYPDTYLIAKESTTETIHSILSNTFDKKIVQGLDADIRKSTHEFDDVLTMASIVQRESRGYEDMRHVAGILWNRIDLGMPVQADATLQYAKGVNAKTGEWWDQPLGADRQLNSPFNTYTHPGLPPHPISNPGLDAIKATLNPLETDDIFYLHDSQGGIHYAETLEEHNANINRYLR
jgi:UPF0755 protein